MVRFRCIRSNGNARKRHETGNGNTGYPSCFRNGLTCFCHVSVYGFLQFRPVDNAFFIYGWAEQNQISPWLRALNVRELYRITENAFKQFSFQRPHRNG